MSDCLWGLLDGINDAGLTVALAFGGRQTRGDGFGITIVVRYLLETCDTVEQAIATLQRLPVHAPYNLTLADTHDAATVYVGPDRAARAVAPAIATNHQEQVDWPEHALATRSVERRPRSRPHRGRVPRAAAVRDRVRPRLRHALHRGVPARAREPSATAGRTRPGTSACTPLRPAPGPSDSGSVQTATSALVLGDLVAQEDLGLSLLSGGAGALDREVAGAHSIDVEKPTRFLERRWVMLTAGMRLKGSVAAQKALVEELDEAGISALGIGIDLVFKRVPPALLEEARERIVPRPRGAAEHGVPGHHRLHQPLAALERPAHLPAPDRDPAPPGRRAERAETARGDGRAARPDARRRRAPARPRGRAGVRRGPDAGPRPRAAAARRAGVRGGRLARRRRCRSAPTAGSRSRAAAGSRPGWRDPPPRPRCRSWRRPSGSASSRATRSARSAARCSTRRST